MEVQGMKRVEDNNPELEVKNLPIHIEEIKSNNSSSTFVVKYLEPVISEEACKRQGLSTGHGYYGTYSCLESSPKLFNEITITSKETGEVLHKYKLDSDYSLAGDLYFKEGGIITINSSVDKKFLGIYINGTFQTLFLKKPQFYITIELV